MADATDKQIVGILMVPEELSLRISSKTKRRFWGLIQIKNNWYRVIIKKPCCKSAISALAKKFGESFCITDLTYSLGAVEKSLVDFIKENAKATLKVMELLCEKAIEEAGRKDIPKIRRRRLLDALAMLEKDFDDCEKYEFSDFRRLIASTREQVAKLCRLLKQEKKDVAPNPDYGKVDNNGKK
jgi:hypothetical protein